MRHHPDPFKKRPNVAILILEKEYNERIEQEKLLVEKIQNLQEQLIDLQESIRDIKTMAGIF